MKMSLQADFLGFEVKENKQGDQYAILNFCDADGTAQGFFCKDMSNLAKLEKYKSYNVGLDYSTYNGKGNFKVISVSKI